MRAILLATVAVAVALPSYSQIYGARRYTQRIQPQLRQQPAQRSNPPQQAPAQPAQPVPAPPAAPVYQPQYRPAAVASTPAKPADPAKAAADKAKNDAKQFEFFKRRAEEGSDHAQYELGLRYLTGRGVAADEKLGREWLSKAAKNGNAQAAKKLTEIGDEKADTVTAVKTESKPADDK